MKQTLLFIDKYFDKFSSLKLFDSILSFLLNLLILKKMNTDNVSSLYLCLNITSFVYLFLDFSQTNLLLLKATTTIEKEFIYFKRIFVLISYMVVLIILFLFFRLDSLLLIYSLFLFAENCMKTFYLFILNEKKENFNLILAIKTISALLLFFFFFNLGILKPEILFTINAGMIFFVLFHTMKLNKLHGILKAGLKKLYIHNLKSIFKKNLILFINQLSYILKFLLLGYIIKEIFINNAKEFRIITMELSIIQILVFSFGYKFFQETQKFNLFFNRALKFIFPLTLLSSILLGIFKSFVLKMAFDPIDILFYLLLFSEFFYLILITFFSLTENRRLMLILTLINLLLCFFVLFYSFFTKPIFNNFLLSYFLMQFLIFIFFTIKIYFDRKKSYVKPQFN